MLRYLVPLGILALLAATGKGLLDVLPVAGTIVP
jgi:hypothetical protein